MFYFRHIDPVIGLVRADPFDPDDAVFEIDRYDQAIGVTLDVEDDPLGADDAGRE